MDRRKTLRQYVLKAKVSLNIEKMLPTFQYGLLLALIFCTAILIVSRLFVFPYYDDVTIVVGIVVLMSTAIFIWWKRVRDKEALHRLDEFYPHNELVTATSFKDDTNPLIHSLVQKAVNETPRSFERFKNRNKRLLLPKVLIGILVSGIMIGILAVFPSASQQDAQVVEKEKGIVNDLKKEVAKLEKKVKAKEPKEQIQELTTKLKEVETSEEALREVVKKQKELKLQEQKLKEKETVADKGNGENSEGLSAKEQEQLKELADLQNALANNASSTQSSLSKLGKPVSFDLQNAIASATGSESNIDSSQNNTSSNNQNQNQGQSNNPNGSQQSNNQNSQGQGNKGNGNSPGQGRGQGNGSGSGQGSGSGSGSGLGGRGQGSGSGSGAGLGQGSRDLLSVPERLDGGSGTEVDSGSLGDGNAAGEQKGAVPVTKGTIRPYEEVIGDYKEGYLESSERMQLPKDLQDIVQSYFSSIESND